MLILLIGLRRLIVLILRIRLRGLISSIRLRRLIVLVLLIGLSFASISLHSIRFHSSILAPIHLSPHLPSLGQAILLSWEELAVSCLTGVLAGLLALAPAALAAECLLALRGKKWLWYLLLFPIALPGSIIGLGLLELVNKSPFHRLGRTVWMPALGLAVHYLPYLLLLLVGAFARLDRDKLALGRVLARTRAKYLFRVRLPMLRGGLLAAFAVAFMLSVADVGTVLMLMPAGMEPLSVKIYNYLHYGSSELVAGFCYFQVLLCMAVMVLTGLFLSARRKGRRAGGGRQERRKTD